MENLKPKDTTIITVSANRVNDHKNALRELAKSQVDAIKLMNGSVVDVSDANLRLKISELLQVELKRLMEKELTNIKNAINEL